ncbi:PQQ-dependent sugar dehydrogenase [Parafrigoribacterium soli]|uniref:PQQ-dependent sugar dehydrogenase n=1 Tax=Parafrigoribacterium soli TaxID=3144663 RepID=UPI0032ED5C97
MALCSALALSGCTGTAAPTVTARPSASASTTPRPTASAGPVQPVGTPTVLAQGLAAPWSVVRLKSGSSLISERDSGTIRELKQGGALREVGTVPGVVHSGEGGLLGIEVLGAARLKGNAKEAASSTGKSWLYAYLTTASDNRIVRMPLLGAAGGYSLGAQESVLTGLKRASNHDGGRIKFGPDGMLYATVGDATTTANAQNPASLNGKILRMTPTGAVPKDNPTPGSLVYSMGHRNPQGLAWDAEDQLWAAEFGQNTWDELNRIEPGGNYGWPTVEGIGKKDGFIDPVQQWKTSEASPSGLAYVDGTLFMAALGGRRLWVIYPGQRFDAVDYFANEYGRIRDVIPGPGDTIWMLTNNTDGRGRPQAGDDKLLQVQLAPLREG